MKFVLRGGPAHGRVLDLREIVPTLKMARPQEIDITSFRRPPPGPSVPSFEIMNYDYDPYTKEYLYRCET